MRVMHLEHDDSPVIGIDLGTSTSAIATLVDARPVLLPDGQNDLLIPSVVQLVPGATGDKEYLVGSIAKASAVTFHDRTSQEVKRLMGTAEAVKLGDKALTPEGVSAVILRYLKAAAEAQLGKPVKDVVLSVPARFENQAREATRRAAQMAGLNVLRLINEPTAAALSYGLDRLDEQQKILIFDFGGGTLDVSVLELFEGVLDVKTSVGDDKLGGKDIDDILVQIFRDAYKDQKGKKLAPASRDRKAAQLLKEEAERYKKLLSEVEEVEVDMPTLTADGGIQMTLTRELLESKCEDLLFRAMALVNEALSRARLSWDDIDVVLPIGGSSRLPLFRRALGFAWGRPIADYDNPDEAVARGAAIAAGMEKKVWDAENGGKKDLMILDVSPHRLGIATIKQVGAGQFIDDYFSEIIPKDAKLPATQRREYATQFAGAAPISVRVYEGTTDSNLCRDHHLIAELPLRNLSSGNEHEPVQVEFRYTLDGTLDVSVQYLSAPAVRSQGRWMVTGGNNGTEDAVSGPPVGWETLWRLSPQADVCLPLIEQGERLLEQSGATGGSALALEVAASCLPDALRALKIALAQNDDAEIRKHRDVLTDLLFEMA